MALHSSEMSLSDLLFVIKKNLSGSGQFAVLLPWNRKDEFSNLAADQGFYPAEIVSVKQTPTHSAFRAMLLFSQEERAITSSEIIIRQNNLYSAAFVHLLKNYYLHL